MDSTTTLLLLGLVVAVAFILFSKFQQPAKEEKSKQRKTNQKKNEQKNQSKNKGKQTKANDAQSQPATTTQKKETQPKQKKKKTTTNNKAGIGFYHGEEVDNSPENVLEFLKGKEFNENEPEEEEVTRNQDHDVDAESDEDEDFTKIRKKATAPPKRKGEKKENEREGRRKKKTAFFKDEEQAKAQAPTGTKERRKPRQPREEDSTQPAVSENSEASNEADNENKPPRHRKPRDVPPRKAKTDSEGETQAPEEEAKEVKRERKEREPREPRKPRPPQGPPSFDSNYETATVDELLNNLTTFYAANPKSNNNASRKDRKEKKSETL